MTDAHEAAIAGPGKACERCKFFDEDRIHSALEGTVHGECHRHAPRPFLYNLDEERSDEWWQAAIWPIVVASDWCGEFEPA